MMRRRSVLHVVLLLCLPVLLTPARAAEFTVAICSAVIGRSPRPMAWRSTRSMCPSSTSVAA